MATQEIVIERTQAWLERVVLGLNFCPFARAPYKSGRVEFAVCLSSTEEDVLESLHQHLTELDKISESVCETLLLIIPSALSDFYDYNQFLDRAERLLVQGGWEGVFQIASFHPDYQFADVAADDVTNYTNRSPYPILHILRESSITRVVGNEGVIEQVIENNQRLLREMTQEQFKRLFLDEVS